MPNARRRNGWKRWTDDDVRELHELVRAQVPKQVIGRRLGRSPEAVAQRAWLEGLTLPGRRTRAARAAAPGSGKAAALPAGRALIGAADPVAAP